MAQCKTTSKVSSEFSQTARKLRKIPKGRAIRLLLVDDCRISLTAWKSYLSSRSGFAVKGLILDRLEALREVAAMAPDVVILSLPLLNTDGSSAIRVLLKAAPAAKVIGFGGDGDCGRARAMLRAGARGFLQKNCSPNDLARAVERVWKGEVFLSSWIQQRMIEDDGSEPARAGRPEDKRLTDREREIVEGIAGGLSNKEVAGRLGMSVRTVEKRRLFIMEKLGISGVAQLTKFAIRNGITPLE